MNLIEKIKLLINEYETKHDDISYRDDDDFNPSDASGGNFDDAYYMGTEHGHVDGALEVLYKLLSKTKD